MTCDCPDQWTSPTPFQARPDLSGIGAEENTLCRYNPICSIPPVGEVSGCAEAIVIQVVPDYKNEFRVATDPDIAKAQHQARKERIDLEMRSFFAAEKEESDRYRHAASQKKKDSTRAANRFFREALDNALRGAGASEGLARFVPDVRVEMLNIDEQERYLLDPDDTGSIRRSCILALGDGSSKYEVPRVIKGEVLQWPTLHCCLDQGLVRAKCHCPPGVGTRSKVRPRQGGFWYRAVPGSYINVSLPFGVVGRKLGCQRAFAKQPPCGAFMCTMLCGLRR